ncbi:MAG: hypothetical protein PHW87_07065 [Methanothrix sp.]|nr:hypothetical protein [Methanothrix sp.]
MEAKRILMVILISISIVGALLCTSSTAYDDSLTEPGAHSKINKIAIGRFLEDVMPYDVYLKNSSLDGEKCKGVAWDREDGAKNMPPRTEQKREKEIAKWIIDGGWSADEPEFTMALVHFYDPKNPEKSWLTDQQFVVKAVNQLSSTKGNPEISAVDWAFDTFDKTKETMSIDLFIQDYSWKDGKEYFKNALASPDRSNENYGKAWRALGETMHLMADMTVPAHVRNDGHAYKEFMKMNWGNPDPYESTTTGAHVESYSDPFYYPPAGLTYRKEPMSLMKDVADFTNSNFLSLDTVPPTTGHTSQVFHTYAKPSINGLIPDDKGYLKSTVEGKEVRLAAPRSWCSRWLDTLPNPMYTVDNLVVIDQRAILIPTAIRANTALLDRFFPRFEVKMTKKETEPGSGRYEVHGEIALAKDAWNKAEWPEKLIIRNGANIAITHEDGSVERSPVTLMETEKDLSEFTREVEADPEDKISLEYDLGGYVVKGGQSETRGIVRGSVTIDGDCSDDPVRLIFEGCDEVLPDISVELTFTYVPSAYAGITPKTIREVTDKNGAFEFKDVPAGSKFKIKTRVKTMDKELEGTMPDPAGELGFIFDFTCKGQLIGNTYYPCGSLDDMQCSPECQLYPI